MGGSGAFDFNQSKADSSQFISPQQLPFLLNLYKGGQQQLFGGPTNLGGFFANQFGANSQSAQPGTFAPGAQADFNQVPGLGQGLGAQGQGFINQLQGAGGGLDQFIGQGSTEQQIQGVTGVVQNFLEQQLGGAGGIAGQANLAGGFGGGRQAVESGAAIGQAAAGLGGITSQILGQDTLRRQQAALGQGQLQNQAAGLGFGGLESIFGLNLSGLLGQFGGLESLAGLLGPPVIEGQQRSRGFGIGASGGGGVLGGGGGGGGGGGIGD